MFQDLRFAVRVIVKDRWYSTVAVVALALGIGVNATVFTLVNAVLIRGLPFRDSASLYMLTLRRTEGGNAGVSYPDFQDWRAQTRSWAGIGAFTGGSMNISDDRNMPEQAQGAWLTADAFRILGQQPLLGRDFAPTDDRPGAEVVVILGYTLWQNRYGGDPAVLGRGIRINSQPGTIIGVMPPNMKFPTNAELWAAFVPTAEQEKRSWRGLGVFGRLQPGVSRAEAQTELNGIAARLATEYPDTNKELTGAVVQTFNERFNGGPIRTVFLALLGAVGFVLLIACANVANLLLSRSAHRAREMAVRIALGATRWRVVRQLLIESVLLGFIGGAIGLLLSLVGVRLFDAAVEGSGKPWWIQFTVDYVVLGYLAAICVLTGILFGFAPALHVSRTNVNEILKEGGRGTAGGRRTRWFSGTMVVVELALTIVLLVGAGLMVRSFLNMYRLDIGIRTDNLMAMRLQLPTAKYSTPEARQAFYDRLAPKLGTLPGVEAVSFTTSVPPQGSGRRGVALEGAPEPKPEERAPEVVVISVSPGFFDTVRVALRRGRDFGPTDGQPGAETIVVNERFAAQFFPGEDPIGRRIRFTARPSQPGPAEVWRTIVGISPTIRHNSPEEPEMAAVAYVPLRQDPPGWAAVLVRSALAPGAVMHAVGREVQAVDADQPLFAVQTLDDMMARQRWPFRVFGSLFAIFAVIALVLSSVGLYAVMAYSVSVRTSEIGVRMALGAAARQVSWLILRQGLVQLGIGLSLGLAGAYFLSRVLRTLLVQITPTDPVTFAVISLLVTLVAVAACLIPARRATRVDPLVALRSE
ncbi:MAG TPA: ABC transporter permease [Vicinamibacterales bacterium]|nr:ABC transporter permease [Vicinamibacterales bacterium]